MRVTAEDGVTTKIYTVIVTRAGQVSTVPLTAPTLTAEVTEGKVDLSWEATPGQLATNCGHGGTEKLAGDSWMMAT